MRATSESRFPLHPAKRVTIMIGRRDHFGHSSLMIELLQRARRGKLAGATVFQALEGYGVSGRIHRTHLVGDDAPVTVVVVDHPERIDSFLKDVADLLDNVLVTIDEVDIVDV